MAELWTLLFDGAWNAAGGGIGIILTSPEQVPILMARKITFPCTNNIAEYEACIAGMKEAIRLGATRLQVFGDSQLVINQAKGETRDEKLRPYHRLLTKLTQQFTKVTFAYAPRTQNQFADALANLASSISIPYGKASEEIEVRLLEEPAFCMQINEEKAPPTENPKSWYYSIKKYLQEQAFDDDTSP